MKRISYLSFLAFLFSVVVTSCNNDKTYAELLKDEQTLIKAYIKRNDIRVLKTFPTVWGEKDYVLTESGLYFHMVDPGNLADMDTIEVNTTIIPRYKQYTLDVEPDTLSNWSTLDFPRTSDFEYGNPSQSSKAFQEAVGYMKRNDTQAILIVPSQLNTSQYLNSVTPLGYILKIKIRK
ncbi:MAG TPA: DUF4827 family protein [Paludibacter sp.]|nr:DUF4827 family protein [Paludibacter sp.]